MLAAAAAAGDLGIDQSGAKSCNFYLFLALFGFKYIILVLDIYI
jgi:hypothetical protein